MTDLLAKLTPAETHLIIANNDVRLKDLMKYTFMDLVFKQVLKTIKIKKESRKKDQFKLHDYVIVGKNFSQYNPLPHERIFLKPFDKSHTIRILFRHFISLSFQNTRGEKNYVNLLKNTPNLDGLFRNGLLDFLFTNYTLNNRGQNTREDLLVKLNALDNELPGLINSDERKAAEVISTIKGNLFLLKNIDFELLRTIDNQLLIELNKLTKNHYESGCGGILLWGHFDSFDDSFDSSFDSASASSDYSSGCSSCGGCSGCGGCGGCGG